MHVKFSLKLNDSLRSVCLVQPSGHKNNFANKSNSDLEHINSKAPKVCFWLI